MSRLWALLWSAGILGRGFKAGIFGVRYRPKGFRGHGSKLMDSLSMLPNQARYHLRYTREYLTIINESGGDCNPLQNVLQFFHDPKGESRCE